MFMGLLGLTSCLILDAKFRRSAVPIQRHPKLFHVPISKFHDLRSQAAGSRSHTAPAMGIAEPWSWEHIIIRHWRGGAALT